jgi:hypothetical protein
LIQQWPAATIMIGSTSVIGSATLALLMELATSITSAAVIAERKNNGTAATTGATSMTNVTPIDRELTAEQEARVRSLLLSSGQFHGEYTSDYSLRSAREIVYLRDEVARLKMREDDAQYALQRIERWEGEFPATGRVWDDGTPMSYFACFGSNGERDFMREIAREMLVKLESP